ncbi:MAG: nucleotidyltransferase domain-containing protein [Oscillospiraceae bacterium]|jgi:predicted nucleotidyltransferase|nr:nucleotidyltransferase domain-containing protein [Oscillospiraceae bacterium]
MSVIYTIEQLKERITPVAEKHGLRAVWVFGSYARDEATENSDVDILVDKTRTELKGLLAMGGLYNDFCEAFEKSVDLITTGALEQESTRQRTPWFVENIEKERVQIYEQR